MPLQVENGFLVQFADDTCLICYENDHSSVSQMLCEDLCSLHLWVRDSRMSFNVNKSSGSMFGLGNLLRLHQFYWMAPHLRRLLLGCCIWQWPSLVFSCFGSLQENGILFILDQRNLLVAILKLLVLSLVLSYLRYAVSVWGPSLSYDLQSRLEKMFNRVIRVVYGLRKFDHVSTLRRKLGWLIINPAPLFAYVISPLS